MSKIFLSLAAALLFSLPTTSIGAESPSDGPSSPDIQVLLGSIRANRKALLAASLGLSADEAVKFWPVYDRYQQEMEPIGDRIAALVEDYTEHFTNLSNEKALQLTEDYLAAEADRMKIRRNFLAEFAKVVPGRTAARFYQIENKMDAVLRYELASTIPVVEDKGGTE